MYLSLTPTFRGWRAALLLVAVACLSPGRAEAGCGDHVTILNAPANPDHVRPGTPETPAPAPPCEGPNCSGNPSRDLPPLAPVTVAGPQVKEVVHNLALVGAPDGLRPPFNRDLTSPRPISRASSVFHPPRRG